MFRKRNVKVNMNNVVICLCDRLLRVLHKELYALDFRHLMELYFYKQFNYVELFCGFPFTEIISVFII